MDRNLFIPRLRRLAVPGYIFMYVYLNRYLHFGVSDDRIVIPIVGYTP
jgi:hypothetical protein